MDPLDIPRIRFAVARLLQRWHVAQAERIVAAMERLRFRARRHVELAEEMYQIACTSAVQHAVDVGEAREIEREEWARD
jgi:hypothetical protein